MNIYKIENEIEEDKDLYLVTKANLNHKLIGCLTSESTSEQVYCFILKYVMENDNNMFFDIDFRW